MSLSQRDVVLRHWTDVISREANNLEALERIAGKALGAPELSGDPVGSAELRTMIETRRRELKRRAAESPGGSDDESSQWRSEVPQTVPTISDEQAESELRELSVKLRECVAECDENGANHTLVRVQKLCESAPHIVSAETVSEHEQLVGAMRSRIEELANEISQLERMAVAASRKGNKQELLKAIRRLGVIHGAHPAVLDDSRHEAIRKSVAIAADDRRQHAKTTKKLLDRERSISSEIKILSRTIRAFHHAALLKPDDTAAFRKARAEYMEAVQKIHAYDNEWFTQVILELADLLAEWMVPPRGAEDQIDRFLDSISAGLLRVRREIAEFEENKRGDHNGDSTSAV